MELLERFLKYVSINTNSNEDCENCPSSPAQWELAKALVKEMGEIGITDARVDEHCYVYGTVPATAEGFPAIGLIAHMDTSSAVAGGPVKAKVLRYEGGDILLNDEKNIVLPAKDYPSLQQDKGSRLVVTDGTTLLGADDKAGIAIIMTAAEKLLNNPSIPHGKICIGFTPDEEIGRGADLFDVEHFGADFAYTLDGGDISDIEYENFNAASAVIRVHGFSIHPGSAKGKMINAAKLAMEFDSMLPPLEIPENTEGYEGFHHLCGIKGEEQEATAIYIIRDHDRAKFEAKKKEFERIADYLNEKYGAGTFELTMKDSYYNMREIIEQDMSIIRRAEDAIRGAGLTPAAVPIRGGTDGARLSFMGLKCPNLGTGGRNYHGVYEYLNADDAEKMTDIVISLLTKR